MSKPKMLHEWIQKEGAKYPHVIVADAWDILFLTTPDEILYNYKGFGTPIVFNAEKSCFPRADLAPKFDVMVPEQVYPYRYLNSGFFVGETDSIFHMLTEMRIGDIPDDKQNEDGSWTCHNDQEYYARWFIGDFAWTLSRIACLDYRGILCQSLHGSGDREFAYFPDRKRIVSLLTGNEPCACHGNGSGKDWLKRIIGWLGL